MSTCSSRRVVLWSFGRDFNMLWISESPTNNELLCMCKSLLPLNQHVLNSKTWTSGTILFLSDRWLTYSENDGRIVSWDEMTFPTEWKVMKFHGSSHHQPAMVCHFSFHVLLPLCADQISMFFLINLADFLDPSCWYISRCYACCIPLLESQQLITSFHGQSSTKKHKIAGDDYFMSLPTVKQIHWWWLVYVIFNFDGDGENNKFIGFVFYPSSESCLGITRKLAPALRDHGLVERSGARWE